ncbi:MAG: hypothetical protein Q9164_003307 [Protoblastenia rupestris]
MPPRSKNSSSRTLNRLGRELDIQTIDYSYQGKTLRECTKYHPELDIDTLLHIIHSINTAIKNACLSGGHMFADRDIGKQYREESEHKETRYIRHFLGQTRVQLSLFGPLENLIVVLHDVSRMIRDWGARARYFEVYTRPAFEDLMLIGRNAKVDASVISKARSLLYDNGRLDDIYINSFDAFIEKMETPIAELQSLLDLLTSIVDCGTGLPCSIMHRETAEVLHQAYVDYVSADAILDSPPSQHCAAQTSTTHHTRNDSEDRTNAAQLHSLPGPPPPQTQARDSTIIDLTQDSPQPSDPRNCLTTTAAAEAAATTPYWQTRFTDLGHDPSALSIHAHDAPIYREALRLTLRALQKAELVVELCERGRRDAERAGLLWQGWMEEVERREEEIERIAGGGEGVEEGEVRAENGFGWGKLGS